MLEAKNNLDRRYELDWLRVIAIAILFFYHTGMMFVSWDWHISNKETSKTFETIMVWLHQWRMPLLLFISGVGTHLALGRRSASSYAKERSSRLLIPLIFGMFIVVPPQIYYEKIAQYSSYLDFYPTVFQFIPYPKGSFSWHHLWFILYLFVYSLIALPIFLWLRKPSSTKFLELCFKLSNRNGGLLLWVVPIILSQFLLRPFFPNETHALVNDWAYFTFYFLFFLFGYISFSYTSLWELFKTQRKLNLAISIVTLVIFYLIYFIPYKLPVKVDFPWEIIKVIVAWFWVITFIGYGQMYLNFNSKLLKYANEVAYPFYILHQTIIIAIGYYVIQWQTHILVKYSVVLSLTFLACFIAYEVLVKRVSFLRLVFGLKNLTKTQETTQYQLSKNSI
ncbi:MAG: acyltransferase family protein [Blastocatellia bacterium]